MNPLREGRLAFYRWFDHGTAKTIPPTLLYPKNPFPEKSPERAAWRHGWNQGAEEVERGDLIRFAQGTA